MAAINKSLAVIEFDVEGHVLAANENFLSAMGYELDEVLGEHHRLFVDPQERNSTEYAEFWQRLARGEQFPGEFRRIAKNGKTIWLQANYNPILGPDNKPFKIVKYATDITEQRLMQANFEGQLAAISKVQAVIEFDLSGNVLTANDNFLNTVGYTLTEIKGKHHRLFVDSTERESQAYSNFWSRLGQGEFDSGRYQRVSKEGKTIWLQATYNPIYDIDGKPFKVVKYATDITAEVESAKELELMLSEATQVMGRLAEGDLTTSVNGVYGENLDSLKCAINKTTQKLCEVLSEFGQNASKLKQSSSELTSINGEMCDSASQSAHQTDAVSAATVQISATVKSVADSIDQLSLSIGEISQNSSEAATVAAEAVNLAEDTDATMRKLSESSTGIGAVIKVINSIAEQTNLLALNATIEAARAGEAGKGFAVVANEVKELAKETARATEEIGGNIATIQNDSENAVDSIRNISAIIERISDFQTTIAAAVEEQSVTTAEISRSVSDTSTGVGEIADNVTLVATVATQNLQSSAAAQTTAADLSEMAQKLENLVSLFTVNPGTDTVFHTGDHEQGERMLRVV